MVNVWTGLWHVITSQCGSICIVSLHHIRNIDIYWTVYNDWGVFKSSIKCNHWKLARMILTIQITAERFVLTFKCSSLIGYTYNQWRGNTSKGESKKGSICFFIQQHLEPFSFTLRREQCRLNISFKRKC